MVAVVAAVAALGVALWNSRGESGELRQLKALNEALDGMPTSAELKSLEEARDILASRVSTWIRRAPARRRLGWSIAASVLGILLALLIFALAGPWLASIGWDETALNTAALVLGVVTAGGTVAMQRLISPTPQYVRFGDVMKDKSSSARSL